MFKSICNKTEWMEYSEGWTQRRRGEVKIGEAFKEFSAVVMNLALLQNFHISLTNRKVFFSSSHGCKCCQNKSSNCKTKLLIPIDIFVWVWVVITSNHLYHLNGKSWYKCSNSDVKMCFGVKNYWHYTMLAFWTSQRFISLSKIQFLLLKLKKNLSIILESSAIHLPHYLNM